jgi:signal transduction histidine kinase/DNA-binding response OmpR family regulator/ligand-binding sensor domain-containing protein
VKPHSISFFYLFLLFTQFTSYVFAQVTGIPFIQNYSPKEYKQHEQNWSIVQDNRGIMYFGNSHGLLEYDGISWRFIKTTNPDIVRSLAVDDSNNIFIGGYNYFGRLDIDSLHHFEYNSLSEKLDLKYKKFNNVWNVITASDGIYFQTDSSLIKWTDKKFKIWTSSAPGNRSFLVNNTLYKIHNEKGLTYLSDSIFVPINGGELFSQNKIYAMKSIEMNKTLIGTRTKGLFVLENKKIIPFISEIDGFLKKNKLTDIELLKDGNIAFATREGGLAIIDHIGKLIQYVNKKNGLADDMIWDLYSDNQFGLWLALNNGISRIELPSPVSYFGESFGIQGNVESISGHNGSIYIATSRGLYFFNPGKSLGTVQKIPGFRPYKIISFGKKLICSGYDFGTYQLINGKMKLISDHTAFSFFRSELDSNRLYLGLEDAIASLYLRNNEWIDEGHLHLISSPIRNVIETQKGDLWLRTSGPIIAKINFPDKSPVWGQATIEYFDEKNGLIPAEQNYIFKFNNEIFFGNKNRLMQYNDEDKQFKHYSKVSNLISDSSFSFYGFISAHKNNYWLLLSSEIGYSVGYLSQVDNNDYIFDTNRFLQLFGSYYYSVYPDQLKENITWFGGPDGIIRYDSNIKKDYDLNFPCLMRKVLTQNDSLIWTGDNQTNKINSDIKILKYNNNALRFEFAAAYFENEKANRFQYFLEGFDKKWSQWTSEPKTIYTNIPEGRYVFRVKAKNIYNVVSKEATYAFIILPPWYRSGWAYGIYGILIIGIVIGLIKLRSYKLENEKKELEKIIAERTDEIQIKNKQLEEQATELLVMDEIKSRFFANISHELRTPLTLIKGPTEELVNKIYPGDKEKALNSILVNTNRMLNLINELLDLSKLESGSMKLNASLYSLSGFINHIFSLFVPLAESRKIHFQFVKSQEDIKIYFDWEKLEKVLFNLLSNAFKFTPQNGYITVAFQQIDSNLSPDGAVEISIHDSGIGIPENEISHIFNRFIQAQNSGNTRLDGSGIGLALSKELVELHHGQIKVTSFVDEGTEFDIIFPLGKDHLQAGEIRVIEVAEKDQKSSGRLDITGLQSELALGPANEQQIPSGEKCLVLIVEDNNEVRDYIKEHLKKDYDIVEANDGRSGLDLANELLPDLIVSDVMMPEMDGFELTEKVKHNELTNHIPIILLTAKASDDAKIEGLETGADAYMAKPFNAKELKVRVKNLIESRHSLREKFKKEFLLEPTDSGTVSLDDEFIKRVHDTIEEKMPDPEFNVDVLLKEFAYGQRQFTRKVIALTGQTPVQFIRIMRLKKALNLIKKRAGTVSQIAYDVGFSNLSYFSKCFRIQFGKLPSEIS